MSMFEEALSERINTERKLPTPPVRRALREAFGLTQDDLARALQCDRSTVAKYETGDRRPRGDRLSRYVACLEWLAGEFQRRETGGSGNRLEAPRGGGS
jgi:transcriptional regulator with XRE-family HTH domain